MSASSHRLPFKPDRPYSGQLIDREKPLKFTLDGFEYEGFAGDSILSSILAEGTDTFGLIDGEPVALDERLHPPVALASDDAHPGKALATDRTPVRDGMELVSLASPNPEAVTMGARIGAGWRKFRKKDRPSLERDPHSVSPAPGPWQEMQAAKMIEADLVVVGGGVAGLSAASEGLERGWRVCIVERAASVGGDASFFGGAEDKARLQGLVDDLHKMGGPEGRLRILTRTEALSLSAGIIRAHQIEANDGLPTGKVIGLKGRSIVLAPGAQERLPLFPGNRLPGVMGARAAHRFAESYGVWRGQTAVINTASSAATQVSLQAADLGISILKLTDNRAEPQSLFFEYAKAYGISLATGLKVVGTEPVENRQLAISLGLTSESSGQSVEALTADRLLVCGGWQPDLGLWHMAGGQAIWNTDFQRLQASGEVEGIALAGFCAGASSFSDCVKSGQDAVQRLDGGRVAVSQKNAVPEFESEDGPWPVSRQPDAGQSCFLDAGFGLTTWAPEPEKTGLAGLLNFGRRANSPELRALSLNEVAAKVVLGEIPAETAGIFASERCVAPAELRRHSSSPKAHTPATPPDILPAYLAYRFGGGEQIVTLTNAEGRGVDVGCLIFANSSDNRPEQSIGVITGGASPDSGEVTACLGHNAIENRSRLVARNGRQTVELQFSENT